MLGSRDSIVEPQLLCVGLLDHLHRCHLHEAATIVSNESMSLNGSEPLNWTSDTLKAHGTLDNTHLSDACHAASASASCHKFAKQELKLWDTFCSTVL